MANKRPDFDSRPSEDYCKIENITRYWKKMLRKPVSPAPEVSKVSKHFMDHSIRRREGRENVGKLVRCLPCHFPSCWSPAPQFSFLNAVTLHLVVPDREEEGTRGEGVQGFAFGRGDGDAGPRGWEGDTMVHMYSHSLWGTHEVKR